MSLLHDGLSPTQAARRFGVSRTWIYQLLARYQVGGLESLEPQSRRDSSNPRALSQEARGEIITLRRRLLDKGLDAGAASIAWHLQEKHQRPPALSTIWRILRTEGLVIPEPKKRPKAYIQRFEAVQPNETWQSDFTHWRLKDGSDVEILNWLDDHSRLLLHCTVHTAITGEIVMETFNKCRSEYGTPFSTLTDNGNVYTARFSQGKNGFEYLKELQRQLDEFRTVYNTQRPHRALEMRTPARCYEATIKATPKSAKDKEHYRLRYDSVDQFGKLSVPSGSG